METYTYYDLSVYFTRQIFLHHIQSDSVCGQIMLQEWKIKGSPEKFVMGNFIVKFQLENQEQDGRTLSRGTHHRS